jgi:hypothetical protein
MLEHLSFYERSQDSNRNATLRWTLSFGKCLNFLYSIKQEQKIIEAVKYI